MASPVAEVAKYRGLSKIMTQTCCSRNVSDNFYILLYRVHFMLNIEKFRRLHLVKWSTQGGRIVLTT